MDNIQLERNEADILNDIGYKFSVTYSVYDKVKKHHKILFWKKPELVKREVMEQFEIKPLVLSTMDRIATLQIGLVMNEDDLKDEETALRVSKAIVKENANNLAEIVALAVLGVDYISLVNGVEKKDDLSLKRLKSLFYENLTSAMLHEIVIQIISFSDYANFINSTRWMSSKRTTQPNDVE